MKHSKKLIFLCVLFVLFILGAIGFNTHLEITNYTIENALIPAELDGLTIVQISDLHNTSFGSNQRELVSAILECDPDIIFLTGDIFSKDDTSFDYAKQLITQISSLAPVYSVSGNHEYLNYSLYMELLDFYKANSVTELVDGTVEIPYGDTNLVIYGINQEHCHELENGDISKLNVPDLDTNDFGIVLYHFANQFDELAPALDEYFCVFSGHTHGGIVRLPFIGGIVANDKTLFPKYDGGLYEKGNLYLVSSRGLGESIIPRFNNNPELVCVTLKSK